MEYTAWTDVPTYINLSNHTYWSLSGDFTKPALDQELPDAPCLFRTLTASPCRKSPFTG